ncbi:MAG: hypothetical protein HRU19_09505 [Pseudobacteriovorax sp.]|nr:hypothetical protein [Pseudobacteriovorax sp.]
MSYKKIGLDEDQKKRLLELIAEEEAALDEQDLSEDDLLQLEHDLDYKLKRKLDVHEPLMIPNAKEQARHLQKLKEKLNNEVASTPSSSNEGTSKAKKVSPLYWSVAAAVLAGVYVFQLNQSDEFIVGQSGQQTMKGSETGYDYNCEYSLLGKSTGTLNGNGMNYEGLASEPINIKIGCDKPGWYHVVSSKDFEGKRSWKNLRTDEDLMLLDRDGQILSFSSQEAFKIKVIITKKAIDAKIELTDFDQVLGTIGESKVLWQDSFSINYAEGGGE